MQGVSDAGCKISQIKSSISKSQNLVTNLDSTSSNKFRHNNSSTLEDNGTSNYKFKYISKPELEAVIKRVRRAKQRKRDEEEWKYFVQLRQEPRDASSWQVCSATGRSNTCVECGLPESTPTSSSSDRGQSQSGEEEISKDSGTVKAAVSVPEIVATTEDVIASHTYQLSPGLLKRLEDLISTVGRMTALLLNPGLCSQLEDEDVDRTIKRSLEFDAMFARNHLYEIQRLLKDTKQLIRSANTIELEAKIVGALKCVTQALQVYMRHVSKGSRIKYQQVVPIFQSITSIEKLLEHLTGRQLFPMRQELEVSCNYLKKLLLETSTTETRSVVSRASHKVPRGHNTRKPSTDLSMYNRRGRDWRRKSAALARQRFGPPLYKKHQRKSGSGSATARGKLDAKLRKDPTLSGTTSQVLSSKSYDKSGLLKEGTNAKDVTFRNATRAVPEEQITTMMEMIPHEPLDESDLCLDDSEFQALKLLNGAQPSIQESKVVDIQKISSRSKDGEDNKTNSAKSARGICNVQLVCLTESSRTDSSHALAQESTTIGRDECTTLNIESTTKSEAEEFKRKMTDYHNSSPHYKDGKATDVVDRLANQILTDMILDFQRDEVDQVIRILYNLEFE
ncbi:uncharacterized protein LOC124367943 isoform X6 [Homalodisca vitripennis]|uniref:uncharacterized protein LOC124367943 isoform X6 n=1 Tax=Homalodisca vitripennis TaxID=197043 RepID=UPI001EEA022A|nr:uncharacterized protein LOC124367943 isoform X6 [Homalodisca vitripennis]